MKFYNDDVDFHIERLEPWQRCERYLPCKTWKLPPYENNKYINYYRDYEAPWRTEKFTRHAYFLTEYNWYPNRIIEGRCLPFFFTMGRRYIKVEQNGPLGLLCAPFPMGIRDVREKSARIAFKKACEEAKQRAEAEAEAKRLKKLEKKRRD